MFMVQQYKKIIFILFLLAFLPRMLALGLLAQNHVDITSVDGGSYIIPALNVLHHGVFSQSPPSNNNPTPDSFRTPLYPFFLFPFIAVGAPFAAIAIIQNMLFAAAVVIVYLMGQAVFHEKTARTAAILMALEPFGLFNTNFITAQNIYYPVFIPALLLMLWYLQNGNGKLMYGSSALFAVAALIKPVVVALFPFILVSVMLKRSPWQTKIRIGAYALIIFFLILSPWLIRNKMSIGTWQFSSISDENLYASNAHLFQNFFHIPDSPILEKRFLDAPPAGEQYDPAITRAIGEAARMFIKKHLGKYVAFHFLFAPRIFITDQYSDVAQIFYHEPIFAVSPDLYGELAHGDLRAFGADFFALLRSPIFFVSLAGKIIWAGFLLLTIRAVIMALRYERHYEKKSIVIFSFLFLCWYAMVFSPVGRAGYRIPVEFLIFLVGLEYLFFPLHTNSAQS